MLLGETACNADPFEGIDWDNASIQALVKEAFNMTLPTLSEDITSYHEFVSLPPAAHPKISYLFTVASAICPSGSAVLTPPSNQSPSPKLHFWPLSQVPMQMSNTSPSSGIQHLPLPPSMTCPTNAHDTTDAHDAGPSLCCPSDTQDTAGTSDAVDNSSWHSCNPGHPTFPICHSEPLTDVQKATCRIANEERKRKEATLSDTMKKLAEELRQKIADIMQEHSIAVEKISKLLTGHINYKKLCEVSFSNALIQAKALEVNTGKSYFIRQVD